MNTITTLQQFNQCAISHRFTGVQTQLWQCLYWLTHTYGQGVCIPTYHLLDTMGISRSQLLRARKALEDAGCLRTHKTGAQRTHYTVMVDGMIVGEGSALPTNNGRAKQGTSGNNNHGTMGDNNHGTASAQRTRKSAPTGQKLNDAKKSVPTGVAPQADIVMNGDMEHHIEAFAAQHGYSRIAQRKLLAWYRMRRQHGWTMTISGFAGTMDALQTYCNGDEDMLIKIVDRTLHHRWKGFHPYRVDPVVGAGSAGPNKTNTASNKHNKSSGRLPKYETKYEDLDYLEW